MGLRSVEVNRLAGGQEEQACEQQGGVDHFLRFHHSVLLQQVVGFKEGEGFVSHRDGFAPRSGREIVNDPAAAKDTVVLHLEDPGGRGGVRFFGFHRMMYLLFIVCRCC